MENLRLLLESPFLSVQLLLDGILIGAIFALAAYGMALVWGVMGLVNEAQGELVMLGGYAAFYPIAPASTRCSPSRSPRRCSLPPAGCSIAR